MASEQIWQRSEIMDTQVITRSSGRRLGIVAEVLVDVDRREVVALGLRDNLLTKLVPGVPRYIYLDSICQVGDVILVETDDAIADIDITPFSSMINSEVITEAGDPLGRVRGFQFDIETGNLQSLVLASVGIALVPEQVLSTYNLPIDEIASSGPDRIIVFEGAEERLQQLTVGVLERLGLGSPPWEKDDDSYVLPTIPAENQLGTGIPAQQPQQRQVNQTQAGYGQPSYPAPVREPAWDEDYRQEPEPILRDEGRAQPQRRYLEAEPEPIASQEWSDASNRDRYDDDYGYDGDGYEAEPYEAEPYDAEPYDAGLAQADSPVDRGPDHSPDRSPDRSAQQVRDSAPTVPPAQPAMVPSRVEAPPAAEFQPAESQPAESQSAESQPEPMASPAAQESASADAGSDTWSDGDGGS
ncbi:MAG: photosystem reaction center subunit H [Synechococcales cyanobacterium RM1_1_8]|nr:photosystem reaction center subunit H [Synechococcales cyanobacterium RM1_1_8]